MYIGIKQNSFRFIWVSLLALCFFFVGMFSSQHPAHAAIPGENSLSLLVNGQLVEADVQPYIDNDRVMVPLRFISEVLGGKVEWLPKEKKVTVTAKQVNLSLGIGQKNVTLNGKTQTIDTPPVIKDERTMVPLRFIGEALGVDLSWKQKDQAVEMALPIESQEGKVKVITSQANLRTGPSTYFSIEGQTQAGDILELLGRFGSWSQIENAAGKTAWISNSLIQDFDEKVEIPVEPETPTQPEEPNLTEEPKNELKNEPAETVVKYERSRTNTTSSRDGDRDDPDLSATYFYINKIVETGQTTTITMNAPGYQEPKSLWLEDPTRLAIDFPGITLAANDQGQSITANTYLVNTVRTEQMENSVARLVLDLKNPVTYSTSKDNNGNMQIKLTPKSETSTNTGNTGKKGLKDRTVVIDPGHGSYNANGYFDPGAIGRVLGVEEYTVNRGVAEKVAELLRAQNIEVIMSHPGGTYVELTDRARVANNAQADIFVSIHSNSNNSTAINGTTMYYYAPESNATLYAQRDQRWYLSDCILQELLKELGRKNLGVREQNFSVLRNTRVPSTLVELAFLSNSDEEKLLQSAEFQTKAAKAICNGILEYFRNT